MKFKIFLIVFCILFNLPAATFAVEVAPRISDREIVEKLVTLEAGQDALRSEMKAGQDALRSEMKAGQDAFRSEMKAGQAALRSEMKAGQAALRSEMKAGQDALGKRMDDMNQRMGDMNQRISSQQTTMLALFSAMVALILALFAYIAWDRRTMIRPVVERLEHLENELFRELDMSHNKGSAITRLINAMRELAKQDEKVATVLRNFSLY